PATARRDRRARSRSTLESVPARPRARERTRAAPRGGMHRALRPARDTRRSRHDGADAGARSKASADREPRLPATAPGREREIELFLLAQLPLGREREPEPGRAEQRGEIERHHRDHRRARVAKADDLRVGPARVVVAEVIEGRVGHEAAEAEDEHGPTSGPATYRVLRGLAGLRSIPRDALALKPPTAGRKAHRRDAHEAPRPAAGSTVDVVVAADTGDQLRD